VPFDKSRLAPAEEIATNVFFITGEPQASVHPVQPRIPRLTRSTALRAGSAASTPFVWIHARDEYLD
jgi:hypothetical protein